MIRAFIRNNVHSLEKHKEMRKLLVLFKAVYMGTELVISVLSQVIPCQGTLLINLLDCKFFGVSIHQLAKDKGLVSVQ